MKTNNSGSLKYLDFSFLSSKIDTSYFGIRIFIYLTFRSRKRPVTK